MLQNYNETVALTDYFKNLKFKNLPTNIILNSTDKYALLVKSHNFSMTYKINISNCSAYIPILSAKFTKFTIDWGDNFTSSYIYDDISGSYLISHIYTTPARYDINIYGDFKGLDNYRSTISKEYNYLYNQSNQLTEISGTTSSYYTNYYLYSINSWGSAPIQTLKNFCINASGLTHIPNTQLPNVNNCMSAFMNCVSLKNCFNSQLSTMNNFNLPANATNCNSMFMNTNIIYNFSNLSNISYLSNINNMFNGTKITGINKNIYENFKSYYNNNPTLYGSKISGNYLNAFPNSISTTILSYEFNKDYFKKILSPHQ